MLLLSSFYRWGSGFRGSGWSAQVVGGRAARTPAAPVWGPPTLPQRKGGSRRETTGPVDRGGQRKQTRSAQRGRRNFREPANRVWASWGGPSGSEVRGQADENWHWTQPLPRQSPGQCGKGAQKHREGAAPCTGPTSGPSTPRSRGRPPGRRGQPPTRGAPGPAGNGRRWPGSAPPCRTQPGPGSGGKAPAGLTGGSEGASEWSPAPSHCGRRCRLVACPTGTRSRAPASPPPLCPLVSATPASAFRAGLRGHGPRGRPDRAGGLRCSESAVAASTDPMQAHAPGAVKASARALQAPRPGSPRTGDVPLQPSTGTLHNLFLVSD